jgi:hypothetical protein
MGSKAYLCASPSARATQAAAAAATLPRPFLPLMNSSDGLKFVLCDGAQCATMFARCKISALLHTDAF